MANAHSLAEIGTGWEWTTMLQGHTHTHSYDLGHPVVDQGFNSAND